MKGRLRLLLLISVVIFLLALAWQIHTIHVPEYGGDELWYATPLLDKELHQLSPFEFVYSGPLKTIVTWVLYRSIGFNIYSVRLFTLALFAATVLVWSLFLYHRKWVTSLIFTLLIFSSHADALFFAKTDINQPTLFNFIFACHLLLFITLVEKGPRLLPATGFILLAFVESNLHIRNIWVMNGFAATYLLYTHIHSAGKTHSLKSRLLYPLVNGWPVLAGWTVSAGYFLFTMKYFQDHPLLIDAGNVEQGKTYIQTMARAGSNFLDYTVGGRVFSIGFSMPNEIIVIKIAGIIVLISIIIALLHLFRHRYLIKDSSIHRLIFILVSMLLLIFIQYALTKPANKPWHGNHLYLLLIFLAGILAGEHAQGKRMAMSLLLLVPFFAVMMTIRIAMQQRFYSPDNIRKGFKRVIYQAPGLDAVRTFIHSNPGTYAIPDWQTGRPLALENHYSGDPFSRVSIRMDQLTKETIRGLKNIIVIRPAPVTQTIPDWSDKRLEKLNARFEKIAGFNDPHGREVYEAGYISEKKSAISGKPDE